MFNQTILLYECWHVWFTLPPIFSSIFCSLSRTHTCKHMDGQQGTERQREINNSRALFHLAPPTCQSFNVFMDPIPRLLLCSSRTSPMNPLSFYVIQRICLKDIHVNLMYAKCICVQDPNICFLRETFPDF